MPEPAHDDQFGLLDVNIFAYSRRHDTLKRGHSDFMLERMAELQRVTLPHGAPVPTKKSWYGTGVELTEITVSYMLAPGLGIAHTVQRIKGLTQEDCAFHELTDVLESTRLTRTATPAPLSEPLYQSVRRALERHYGGQPSAGSGKDRYKLTPPEEEVLHLVPRPVEQMPLFAYAPVSNVVPISALPDAKYLEKTG